MTTEATQPLTLDEYAKFVKLHKNTVARLAQQGKIPQAFKIGNQWRFSPDAIPLGAPRAKSGASNGESDGITRARQAAELAEQELREAKAKKERAELEGTLLKGEELARKEAELLGLAQQIERDGVILDDREQSLNAREARIKTVEQGLSASASDTQLKKLDDREKAIDQKTIKLNELQATAKAEQNKLATRQASLDTRAREPDERESKIAQDKQRLNQDVGYLSSVVNTLHTGGGRQKKDAIKEFESHQWLTIKA
jgi:excisionase family DNA binding protein